MKILNLIMAFSFVCCTASLPLSADTLQSKEYKQLSAEISDLNKSGLSPILKQMAINYIERNIKKTLKAKEKQLSRLAENIEWYQERLLTCDQEEYCDKDYLKHKMEKSQEKIPECQEDIELYRDLLTQVQALK